VQDRFPVLSPPNNPAAACAAFFVKKNTGR
jgi:hypothetical protein